MQNFYKVPVGGNSFSSKAKIRGNLSRSAGTGYLDEIPFKLSFPVKNTFLITYKNYPVPAGECFTQPRSHFYK